MPQIITTPYTATYPAGKTLTIEAPADITVGDTRHLFMDWTVNGTKETGNPLTLNVDRNTTVVANYSGVSQANLLWLLIPIGVGYLGYRLVAKKRKK